MSVHYEYRTLWCHKNMDVRTGRLSKELQLWIINVLRWAAGGEESDTLNKRDEAGSHQADKNVLVGHSLTVCLIWEAFPHRHSDTGKNTARATTLSGPLDLERSDMKQRTVRLHPHKRDDTLMSGFRRSPQHRRLPSIFTPTTNIHLTAFPWNKFRIKL